MYQAAAIFAIPVPEVDLTRPRSRPDPQVFEEAGRYALKNALSRLVSALTKTTVAV